MSKPKPPQNEAEQRQQRLASALRDNLKRRKAQARARSGASDGESVEKPKNTPPAKG